jgi:hypothetical protein
MTPLENIRTPRIPRAILLVVGCAPMIVVHGMASLLMIFPLASLAAGNWLQALFLLWWLIGSAGLLVLVYSSVTFNPSSRQLPVWQVVALFAGMATGIPPIFGFLGEWWTSVSGLLVCSTSAYILVSTSWSPERPVGDTPKAPNRVVES